MPDGSRSDKLQVSKGAGWTTLNFIPPETRQPPSMAASDTIVNPLHPSVVDKIDPDFARIYNRYQGRVAVMDTNARI